MASEPVFDPYKLQSIVKKCLGNDNYCQLLDSLTSSLAEEYPRQINTKPRFWLTNKAGGALGQLALLHGSLNEYLFIFNTPLATSGHSGKYNVDIYDIMLTGEMGCAILGEENAQTCRKKYLPGDMANLAEGKVKAYDTIEGTSMLEYGRGNVPAMLPFGLVEIFTSTLDFAPLKHTLAAYGGQTLRKLFTGEIE